MKRKDLLSGRRLHAISQTTAVLHAAEQPHDERVTVQFGFFFFIFFNFCTFGSEKCNHILTYQMLREEL